MAIIFCVDVSAHLLLLWGAGSRQKLDISSVHSDTNLPDCSRGGRQLCHSVSLASSTARREGRRWHMAQGGELRQTRRRRLQPPLKQVWIRERTGLPGGGRARTLGELHRQSSVQWEHGTLQNAAAAAGQPLTEVTKSIWMAREM